METALAVAALVITALVLAFVMWNGRRQSAALKAWLDSLSERTERQREAESGKGWPETRVRELHFFLPPKSAHPIAAFEGIQKENEDLIVGKEIRISKRWVTELHVRFALDAPQRLTGIRWGFAPGTSGARVLEFRNTFAVEIAAEVPKEIFRDRHGFWHIEMPLGIVQPGGTMRELAFTVKGDRPGRFPLEFEILTAEGGSPFRETLWVEVTE